MYASSDLAEISSVCKSCPHRQSPAVGVMIPAIARNVVVFPAPLRPSSPSTCPGST